ncbi:hypothetical protein ACVGVM_30050 (plasmid) [Pseudonocardia bannensis]|uniref:Uncharacterized protein n=1 Tax=Pseudonocardia bannensis TaxID=630973 RepID=A0A848DM33_9PSEU|nr:hypothetical protein [Pseudonocardia bannensis]NMH93782.1 hypothetical protein [Pseudonocardia bannensis]
MDLQLVAQIVRRAGLDCRVDKTPSVTALHARRAMCDPAWTVIAGTCNGPSTPLAFIATTASTGRRLLRDPDERHFAALIVLQALRDNPHELLTYDEARAFGLADSLIWP